MNSRTDRPAAPAGNDGISVVTKDGTLVGLALADAVTVFRGIRYAEPPIGELRWKPPVAAGAWRGLRRAVDFGPACLQVSSPPGSVYANKPRRMSEDCLFLNVWRAPRASGAPVMVWLHGGSLRTGDPASGMYDGSQLARKGVVVVSVNYRLGVLGFFAHPQLTGESPHGSSGNYGLLDQIEALRWVRDNIAAFGGDPGNVTLFGESAGALSAMALMTSPLARGLFHKVIVQSGYLGCSAQLKQACFGQSSAESNGMALADKLDAQDLAALRAIPAGQLVERTPAAGFNPRPTIDGWVLPRQLVECLDLGEQAPVPMIVGFNEGEMRSMRAFVPTLPATAAEYEAHVRGIYRDLAESYLVRYPATNIEESALAAARDATCGWSAERLARAQTGLGVPAYLYFFSHHYPAEDAVHLEAFHASELPYEFGRIGTQQGWPELWPRPPDDATERALSEAIMSYFTSFARDGVPAAPGETAWRPYRDDGAFVEFRDTPRPGNHLLAGAFELHEEVITRRRAARTQHWGVNIGLASPPVPSAKGPDASS